MRQHRERLEANPDSTGVIPPGRRPAVPAQAGREIVEPLPIPALSTLDLHATRFTQTALRHLTTFGIGYFEALAAAQQPNVTRPKDDGNQVRIRGDVRLIYDPREAEVIAVASLNSAPGQIRPRTPLIPPNPPAQEEEMAAIKDATPPKQNAVPEPAAGTKIPAPVRGMSAGEAWDSYINMYANAPGKRVVPRDVLNAFREQLLEYYTDEDNALSNLYGTAGTRVTQKRLNKLATRQGYAIVGKAPRETRTSPPLAKAAQGRPIPQQPQPEPAGPEMPPATAPPERPRPPAALAPRHDVAEPVLPQRWDDELTWEQIKERVDAFVVPLLRRCAQVDDFVVTETKNGWTLEVRKARPN